MSHDATSWAFKQRGLKPVQRLILLGLADRHHQATGCWVDLDQLADLFEISRARLEEQTMILDRKLLIQCLTFTGLKGTGPVLFRLRIDDPTIGQGGAA